MVARSRGGQLSDMGAREFEDRDFDEDVPFPDLRVAALPEARVAAGEYYSVFDGEKFPGGYGPTRVLEVDYWTLRARSAELYRTSIYGRGIIRRLVTSIINVGLTIEATPDPEMVGLSEEQVEKWSEQAELAFHLWGSRPKICDARKRRTFSALQRVIKQEALVVGDVLVVELQDPRTKMPQIRVVSGSLVQTPLAMSLDPMSRVRHGVELDENGDAVAYYVRRESHQSVDAQDLFTYDRIPAYTSSGRRQAWLVYGPSDERLDDVRGMPILALALQSLREIDRYRDSTQRKALLASLLTFVVTKNKPTIGTTPLVNASAGFSRTRVSEQPSEAGDAPRRFNVAKFVPGQMVDELAEGEDIKTLGAEGTDEKFAEFEAAIIAALSWHFQIPPEILRLSFNANYSASQAANNEFQSFLDLEREDVGDQIVRPIYEDVILSLVLLGTLKAPGLLEAIDDPTQWLVEASWLSCEMAGAIKPSVDPLKRIKAIKEQIDAGLMTRARAARELGTGKFSKIARQLAKENALLVAARAAITEEQKALKPAPAEAPPGRALPAKRPAKRTDEDAMQNA